MALTGQRTEILMQWLHQRHCERSQSLQRMHTQSASGKPLERAKCVKRVRIRRTCSLPGMANSARDAFARTICANPRNLQRKCSRRAVTLVSSARADVQAKRGCCCLMRAATASVGDERTYCDTRCLNASWGVGAASSPCRPGPRPLRSRS